MDHFIALIYQPSLVHFHEFIWIEYSSALEKNFWYMPMLKGPV